MSGCWTKGTCPCLQTPEMSYLRSACCVKRMDGEENGNTIHGRSRMNDKGEKIIMDY